MDKTKALKAFDDVELVESNGREGISKVYPNALFLGNEEKGDFGFCATTQDSVKIVFRGSDDIFDWLSNFGIDTNSGIWVAIKSIRAIFSRLINEIGYHIGFHDSMSEYINAIIQYIQSSGNKKIEIIGHSRGGADGLDIAGRLCRHSYDIQAIVFGCPKMCTKDSELYHAVKRGHVKVDAFINGMDIVPRIPFTIPFGENLVRIGTIHRIGNRPSFIQRLRMYKHIYELIVRRDVEGIKDVLEINRRYVDDHQPKEYRLSLQVLKLAEALTKASR